jgi:hypothetical protein
MTATATATLTSTGSLAAAKSGDVITYRVVVTGNTLSIPPPLTLDMAGQAVAVVGNPWVAPLPVAVDPPVVSGIPLTFAQQPDPNAYTWKATV